MLCKLYKNVFKLTIILFALLFLFTGITYSTEKSDEIMLKNYLKELKIEYEKMFKKPSPVWKTLSSEECLKRFDRAIYAEFPYLTESEEKELEIKLRAEYEKKFGKPISDFELSIVCVYFGWGKLNYSVISVTRTVSGALVKYVPLHSKVKNLKPLEMKLTLDEWLDFINNLYKLRINEWEKNYYSGAYPLNRWKLEIFPLDKESLEFEGNQKPLNWDEFRKIINDMEERIIKNGLNLR